MLVCLHISRQKAQKANLQLLWGQAKPAAMQIYQSGWQGSSQTLDLLEESLHVLRRIQNHEEDFAGGSPVLRGLVSEFCSLFPLSPCQDSHNLNCLLWGVSVWPHNQKKAIWDAVIQTALCELRKLDHGVRTQSSCSVGSNGEYSLRKEEKQVKSLLFPGTEFLLNKHSWELAKWT